MLRFQSRKTLWILALVHPPVHYDFNKERHLASKDLYRERPSAALAE